MKLLSTCVLLFVSVFALAQSEAEMAAMMKPPAQIKQLSFMLGNWTGAETMYMGPKPEKSTSTLRTDMTVGGRFIRGTYRMKTSSGPMDGMSMITYDPSTKQWIGTWFDSMTSQPMNMKGTFANGKLVLTSDPTPMPGMGDTVIRMTWAKKSATQVTFLLEMKQGETWVKGVEGLYKKKK